MRTPPPRRPAALLVTLLLGACGGGGSDAAPPTPRVAAWTPVGVAGFSAGGVSDLSFDADAAGTLFVAFVDAATGNRVTVMKYAGSAWTPVGGPGFSATAATRTNVVVHGGVPHVAFADAAEQAIVMRLDPAGWTTVGQAGFSDAVKQLALASDGTRLFAASVRMPPASLARVTGMVFDATSWTTLTNLEAIGNLVSVDDTVSLDAAGGKLHFSYRDYFGGNYRTWRVMEYDVAGGAAATEVGAVDVAPGGHVRAPVASSGAVAYWALVDGGNLSYQYPRPLVYRMTPGGPAAPLGSFPSDGYVSAVALAADAGGPYVAYTDTTASGKVVVKRWSGDAWTLVGTKGFSADTASSLQMRIVRGTPHVAFQDAANGKATVMKYE